MAIDWTIEKLEDLLDKLQIIAVYGRNQQDRISAVNASQLIRERILEPMRKEKNETYNNL